MQEIPERTPDENPVAPVTPPEQAEPGALSDAATPKRRTAGRVLLSWGREILETVLPALLIVLVINIFLGEARRVEMQSMEPNLYENQRLIVEKISYRLHSPRRGDIIVLRLPSRGAEPPLIKRVIGLPGDTVEIKDGLVYINGQQIVEPYLHQATYPGMAALVVPAKQVFVLGDNRGYSNDSRYFGCVPVADVIGRACFRYWPLSQIGPIH
jgi:signal peptidase I